MNNSTIYIIFIAFFALLAIGFFFSFLNNTYKNSLPLFFACFCCIFICLGFCYEFLNSKSAEQIEQLKTNKEYTFYIDGAEVDCNNIDISLYNYTIDKEQKKVFLTGN